MNNKNPNNSQPPNDAMNITDKHHQLPGWIATSMLVLALTGLLAIQVLTT